VVADLVGSPLTLDQALDRGWITSSRLIEVDTDETVPLAERCVPVEFVAMPSALLYPAQPGEDLEEYLTRALVKPGGSITDLELVVSLGVLEDLLTAIITEGASRQLTSGAPSEVAVDSAALHALIFEEHVLVEESPPRRESLGRLVAGVMAAAITAFAPATAVAVAHTTEQASVLIVVSGATTLAVGAGGAATVVAAERSKDARSRSSAVKRRARDAERLRKKRSAQAPTERREDEGATEDEEQYDEDQYDELADELADDDQFAGEDFDEGSGESEVAGVVGALRESPAVSRLGEAARDYAKARGGDVSSGRAATGRTSPAEPQPTSPKAKRTSRARADSSPREQASTSRSRQERG
jgi:hypothetical protein